MALPQINQNMQGLNVQTPRVSSGQQYTQGGPQNASGMPQRVFNRMVPDNGQHGGAQRYMTAVSGAMNMANQVNMNPYGNTRSSYYGRMPNSPAVQGQLTSIPTQTLPSIQQTQASYRQALQDRMMNTMNRALPNQMQMQMPAPTMPQMFMPRGI